MIKLGPFSIVNEMLLNKYIKGSYLIIHVSLCKKPKKILDK